MRFLIFNWRDIRNPLAGGAEVVTHEVAKRWVSWGHEVAIFTSKFNGSRAEDTIDGVRIIRAGNPLTVYLHARRYYKKHFKGKFDVVIEEANGYIPWYSYYYVKEPLIGLRFQSGRNFNEFNPKNSVSHYELPPVVNLGVYALEPYITNYYKNIPLLMVAESTRQDFIDLNFPLKNLHVVPAGISISPIERIETKEKEPTFIYVGRLKKAKRVDHILRALKIVKSTIPEVQLWVVGDGPHSYESYLRKMVRQLEITDNVKFLGYLKEGKKYDLLKRAHALIITSVREGWGLVVTEANAMGTPAIGYDIPGLRDSIKNSETGILVESGNIEKLAYSIIRLVKDRELLKTLTYNAWKWSREFDWDRSAKVWLSHIDEILMDLSKEKRTRINKAAGISIGNDIGVKK